MSERTRRGRRLVSKATPLSKRLEVVARFERSGQSAAGFAREQGICYGTLCNWIRAGREGGKADESQSRWVEVEAPRQTGESVMVVGIGDSIRVEVRDPAQVAWVCILIEGLKGT